MSPRLRYALKRKNELYMEKLSQVEKLESEGDIIIRPSVNLSDLDNSKRNLESLIGMGFDDALLNKDIEEFIDSLGTSKKRNFYFSENLEIYC